jgi:single-stranded DNA-binding protein
VPTRGADFIPINCLGTPAEQHHKYFTKGRLVSITGRLAHSQWTDKDTVLRLVQPPSEPDPGGRTRLGTPPKAAPCRIVR